MFNHEFDPNLLKTHIMTDEDFDPTKGDIFIPDDMRNIFDQTNENGDLVGPAFKSKSMVLTGPQGTGKTSLFNTLTDSTDLVSKSLKTCTVTQSTANALGPAKDLLIKDTPGTANSVRNGMAIDEAMEIRKAITSGEVTQILAVISFTNNERKQALSDQLGALDGIFDCETFKRDALGNDVTMQKGQRSSPSRTRPFLVVTHRDCALMGREKFPSLIKELRKDFPWIGPVAFIDRRVDLGWLYDTIVACAGYSHLCCTNHSIPLVEMFTKFKITFTPLSNDWMDYIEDGKSEMNFGVSCAVKEINEVVKAREAKGALGGNEVDMVAPTFDCILRFVDDLYEKITFETLAKGYDTTVEELWTSTDEHINNERVNTMNVIKQQLAGTVDGIRKKILRLYPTAGDAAVYKKCLNCGAVYVKPTGCDYIGRCGGYGAAQDASHNGTLKFELYYEYDRENMKLHIREGDIGILEQFAWTCRRRLRDTTKFLSDYRSQFHDDFYEKRILGTLGDYGCGIELRWSTMVALSTTELQEKGLVPSSNGSEMVSSEPCLDASTMPIVSFLTLCGPSYMDYVPTFHNFGVKTVKDFVDLAGEDWTETFVAFRVKPLHRMVIEDKLNGMK